MVTASPGAAPVALDGAHRPSPRLDRPALASATGPSGGSGSSRHEPTTLFIQPSADIIGLASSSSSSSLPVTPAAASIGLPPAFAIGSNNVLASCWFSYRIEYAVFPLR
mmetsp:Transcript_29819/g.60521  ORF Transcript_29819/g.60521 Transcript_29819/m.60521 type:complete len:109 (+) Transcript_29819:146-472(+)